MYEKVIEKIFERLILKHNEKGESFRTMPEKRLNEILSGEFEKWNISKNQLQYNVKYEINKLCDIVVASIIKLEWLIQGGQIEGEK